jgi:MFS family permease
MAWDRLARHFQEYKNDKAISYISSRATGGRWLFAVGLCKMPQMRLCRPARQQAFTAPITLLLGSQLLSCLVVAPAVTFFPVYLDDLGYSAVLIAGIVTLQRVMGLIASLAGGVLTDSIGAKRTLVLGQLCYFFGTLLFLARAPLWVSVIWAINGLGTGLHVLGGQTYLLEKADHAFLGVLTALYLWGYTVGTSVSNPLAAALMGRVGYPGLTPFMAVPAAATLILTAAALPSSQHLAGAIAASTGYRDIAFRPSVLMLAGLRFLPTFCYGMAMVFVPLQLKNAGATNPLIALFATASSLFATLAQLLVGRIADRASWKAPTAAAYALLAASSLAIGARPGSLLTVFACGTVGIGAAWSLSTLLPTLVSKVTAASERGRVLGYVHLFWNAAMILSSLAGGYLFETGRGLPLLSGGVASLCAIALLPAFFRETKRDKTLPAPMRASSP